MNRITREKDRVQIRGPLLLAFSTCFVVWQMGVLFYSGTTMSLFGRTPVPLTQQSTALVIALGYAASIAALCLFPRRAVWMERVLLPIALVCVVLMLLPLSPRVITALFYIEAFVCVFSIGTMASLASQLFTIDTVWRDGIISMVAGGAAIALLQNDFFEISFTAFTLFSIALIAALALFHWLIPADITVPFAQRKDETKTPGVLFFGVWLISGFSTLLLCFASSYAESAPSGLSVMYLSAAAMGAALWILTRRKNRSIKVFGAFLALSVLGFVLAFLSLSVPGLRIAVCALLGPVVVLASLWIFFCAVAFAIYPTRFIGAIGAAVGFALAMAHSGLLEALRENVELLYGVYAALSVALLIIYHFLEPYMIYAWGERKREQRAAEAAGRASAELPAAGAFGALSEQERNLARLILSGYSETDVARKMNISINTQKSYRKNLYTKLNIHSKRELFELAGGKP